MVGNAFSPRYYAARQRTTAPSPLDYCTMHAAVYGPGKRAFALTEHDARDVRRTPDRVEIGKSSLAWESRLDGQTTLVARLDELTAPFPRLWPRRLRGTVRLSPGTLRAGTLGHTSRTVALDASGEHLWTCHAPEARVTVSLDEPNLVFQGSAYFDENVGTRGLEEAFASWQWSRASLGSGRSFVHYATEERATREGSRPLARTTSLCFSKGVATPIVAPPAVDLGLTRFGLRRRARLDGRPIEVRTLEDGPHYARSLVRGRVLGEDTWTMHETFDGARFSASWVRFLLPFRMRGGRSGHPVP